MATVEELDDEVKKDTKKEDIDKNDESLLRELDYYHGYVAREDLSSLIKAEGDFIVRMSEVEISKNSTTAKKEIVMSLMIASGPDNAEHSNVKSRNVVIRRSGGVYRIDSVKNFKSVKELVEFYTKNHGTISKHRFILKNAVTQQDWEFSHNALTFTGKILGEGAYGMVKEGRLELTQGSEPVPVAAKMAKGNCELSKAKIKEMMREARLMRNLKHKNVVRLYGVAVLDQPLYILLELINGGELKKHLATNVGKVDLKEKLQMCLGAAQGLEYLHKNGYIHRDIAARNCLYTEDKIVKISDFGLSRNVTEYKMKSCMSLPIKWLAPETIQNLVFSTRTDVYSYGILIYEIFVDGGEPWPGVVNADVKKSVGNSKFLQMPDGCPPYLKAFVSNKIFLKDPTKRGSMSDAVEAVEAVINNPNIAPPQEKAEPSIVPASTNKSARRSTRGGQKTKKRSVRQKRKGGTVEEKTVE